MPERRPPEMSRPHEGQPVRPSRKAPPSAAATLHVEVEVAHEPLTLRLVDAREREAHVQPRDAEQRDRPQRERLPCNVEATSLAIQHDTSGAFADRQLMVLDG